MGDVKFSDSLELMGFLANLVGAEHIERCIPPANADTERAVERPHVAATETREMPKFVVGKKRTRNLGADGMQEQVIADAARLVQWRTALR